MPDLSKFAAKIIATALREGQSGRGVTAVKTHLEALLAEVVAATKPVVAQAETQVAADLSGLANAAVVAASAEVTAEVAKATDRVSKRR